MVRIGKVLQGRAIAIGVSRIQARRLFLVRRGGYEGRQLVMV